ncbi:hypothetical protein PYCCODRAFT_1163082 [Trametes coccinea BRFM310]|uniref:Uncharacterized protein n=1 Tax=Trametes coccinea (strain BRFM310) TaxID=1353009 RepID=A0A1Y2J0C6_TRAC3|nr:hypothetical protein PYCCODRAFT_1163082 [Trametes coccinea BRFM310]
MKPDHMRGELMCGIRPRAHNGANGPASIRRLSDILSLSRRLNLRMCTWHAIAPRQRCHRTSLLYISAAAVLLTNPTGYQAHDGASDRLLYIRYRDTHRRCPMTATVQSCARHGKSLCQISTRSPGRCEALRRTLCHCLKSARFTPKRICRRQSSATLAMRKQ